MERPGGYAEYAAEQLESLRGLRSGRFFGGTGLWSEGTLFAMVMGNTLYFAVDDATRPRYQAMGSRCFSYATKKGQVEVRKYFEVPVEILEDQAALAALAREALETARRSIERKKARR